MARGQPRSDTTKATAIALAQVGSVAEASRALSVPPTTIRDWLRGWRDGTTNDAELQEHVDRLVTQYRMQGEVEMAEAIAKAVELTRRTLDHYLDREDGPPLKMAELRDLNVSTGILCDKLLALRGQPGSISARFSYSRHDHFDDPDVLLLDGYAAPANSSTEE